LAEGLYSIDLFFFYAVNHFLQNSLFDVVMPWLTEINQHWSGRVVVLSSWLFLLIKAGKGGRIAALLLIPGFIFSDQLNSSFLKFLFERTRPCHVLSDVHLLVSCGSGFSFPSSHAVNNFAAAVILSSFLPSWKWGFFMFAFFMAFSRVYVGVHYPSDIAGGAIIGAGCGWIVVFAYRKAEAFWLDHRRKKDGVETNA
jgi:undecaprenyl-diphosphatase